MCPRRKSSQYSLNSIQDPPQKDFFMSLPCFQASSNSLGNLE